ncbi:MAG TPA: M28 family peptidase [Hanamia sp.]
MKNLLLFLIFVSQYAVGQRLTKSDKKTIDNLKMGITYLESDKLEGRRTGTRGEQLAYEYISEQFKNTGLTPKGDENGFIQPFEINEGKQILSTTYLVINGDSLDTQNEFFPFIFSSDGVIKADASPAFQEKGMPWFLDIKDILVENKNNPHFDLEEDVKKTILQFEKKGASACIVYNSGIIEDEIKFDGKSKITRIKIPVVFVSKNVVNKYLKDKTANLNLSMRVALGNKKRTGHNVIGYIDNGAAHTIILGAHYDHLGYGEDHNSLWTGKPEIYNGADDNASGTAAVIELAKFLKNSKLKENNYLFICFSGEELGLYGSKYFTENPTIPLSSVDYMINFDMVGRLNDSTHRLTIGGYGTSPSWGKVLPEKTKSLNIKFDSSGIGPSDHTSFYLKDIPVLFFFTGIHADYHKPTDDADKINFEGEFRVLQYVENVLKETNNSDKLAFSKTREPKMESMHFTVSLGFMPDYTYSGMGVRADDIIDGKIAQQIGMKAGDVIVNLGDFHITDIYNYMTALSTFKKGDATKVSVMRGKDELSFNVTF